MDLILNGKAQGNVAATLLNNGFNMRALRPWIGDDGNTYIANAMPDGSVRAQMVHNATATLRKDEWKLLDDTVVMEAKQRLNVVADLRAAGLTYSIPNGMGTTVLETETMTDITDARTTMDPAVKTETDRPEFELTNLPLPVIHKDFSFSARQIAASRRGGSPLDTTGAMLATRKVAEAAEKLTLGTSGSYKYGGGYVYGLTNFPDAITTTTVTIPTDTTWTPALMVEQVLAMRQASEDAFHYGPWMLYNSPSWDQYLDKDYSESKGDNTLRERLERIRGIDMVKTADYLGSGYKLALVQKTSDVVRLVIGLDFTTVQWETMGGLMVHFKVMAILVPQFRSDSNGNSGIVYSVAS